MLLFAPSCCTVVLLSAPLAEAVATAATSAARSSASMRASAAEKRASTACVDVSSSKIESARRLVWRVADQRIALLPAMHIDELCPRLAPEVGWGRPSPPHAQRLMAASGESPPELTSAPRCLAAHMLAPRYAPRCLAAHMLAPRYL